MESAGDLIEFLLGRQFRRLHIEEPTDATREDFSRLISQIIDAIDCNPSHHPGVMIDDIMAKVRAQDTTALHRFVVTDVVHFYCATIRYRARWDKLKNVLDDIKTPKKVVSYTQRSLSTLYQQIGSAIHHLHVRSGSRCVFKEELRPVVGQTVALLSQCRSTRPTIHNSFLSPVIQLPENPFALCVNKSGQVYPTWPFFTVVTEVDALLRMALQNFLPTTFFEFDILSSAIQNAMEDKLQVILGDIYDRRITQTLISSIVRTRHRQVCFALDSRFNHGQLQVKHRAAVDRKTSSQAKDMSKQITADVERLLKTRNVHYLSHLHHMLRDHLTASPDCFSKSLSKMNKTVLGVLLDLYKSNYSWSSKEKKTKWRHFCTSPIDSM